LKIAFVAPFYGAKAAGGAEAECRNTALHLAASGLDVEVLTTCLLDLQHDWGVNSYREGTTSEDGIKVHRFRAEMPDLRPFGALNQRLLRGEVLLPEEQEQFLALHINSFGLYRRLAEVCSEFDWFCFIPYLFGTTFHGTMICPGKSILIPCLHDEGYARMGIMRTLFERVAGIVYHTLAEKELARRLYGGVAEKGLVLGEGIETEFESDGECFRKRYGIVAPFVLYAGRKDATKNVDILIRDFMMGRTRFGKGVKLVMIGPGSIPIPATDSIVDLGFVPEKDKRDAFSAALCLCQPSLNESFSIVMMEAWVCGAPCLVHEQCAVTREHIVASGGGLYFNRSVEFAACVDYFLKNPDMAKRMSEAGRQYVVEHFAWSKIVARYCEEIFGGSPA
jgi:glycosyltransferase involved in cell wall biosynthesis